VLLAIWVEFRAKVLSTLETVEVGPPTLLLETTLLDVRFEEETTGARRETLVLPLDTILVPPTVTVFPLLA
jgi:hypothetical protein